MNEYEEQVAQEQVPQVQVAQAQGSQAQESQVPQVPQVQESQPSTIVNANSLDISHLVLPINMINDIRDGKLVTANLVASNLNHATLKTAFNNLANTGGVQKAVSTNMMENANTNTLDSLRWITDAYNERNNKINNERDNQGMSK